MGSISCFGEVARKARQLIGLCVKNYWKLKTIDTIQHELPQPERTKIIEALIDQQNIRELLLRKAPPAPSVVNGTPSKSPN